MSLEFLNKLHSLEQELCVLLDYVESPEEAIQLGPEVLKAFDNDLDFLVGQFIKYVLICQKMNLSTEESDEVTAGLDVVKTLMIESLSSLLQKVLLNRSGNMELTRDLFRGLHFRQKIQDSTETLPSKDERLLTVISTVSMMEKQYLEEQKVGADTTTPAEQVSEAPEEQPAEADGKE